MHFNALAFLALALPLITAEAGPKKKHARDVTVKHDATTELSPRELPPMLRPTLPNAGRPTASTTFEILTLTPTQTIPNAVTVTDYNRDGKPVPVTYANYLYPDIPTPIPAKSVINVPKAVSDVPKWVMHVYGEIPHRPAPKSSHHKMRLRARATPVAEGAHDAGVAAAPVCAPTSPDAVAATAVPR